MSAPVETTSPAREPEDRWAAQRRERLVGVGLTLVSAGSFSWLPIFYRYAQASGASVSTVLALRFTLAALVSWALLARQGRPRLTARRTGGLGLLGALYVVQSTCFFISSAHIPVAMTSILLYLYPALVALLAWLFLHERLTPLQFGALALALGGALLTVGQELRQLVMAQTGGDLLGVGMGVLAAIFYSIYIVLGARLQRGIPAQVASTLVMSSAGLIFTIAGLATGSLQTDLPLSAYAWIVALALICTVLPIQTFFAGMRRIGPAQASIVSAVEPTGTVVLSALLLQELLKPIQLLGGALILAAVVLLSYRRDS